MTTTTLTLTDFLLARIAEDEDVVDQSNRQHWQIRDGLRTHRCFSFVEDEAVEIDCPHVLDPRGFQPTIREKRILTECDSKRRIVTLMGHVRESWENMYSSEGRVMWPDVNRREKMHALTILENLALPYADHPDYREEWRP